MPEHHFRMLASGRHMEPHGLVGTYVVKHGAVVEVHPEGHGAIHGHMDVLGDGTLVPCSFFRDQTVEDVYTLAGVSRKGGGAEGTGEARPAPPPPPAQALTKDPARVMCTSNQRLLPRDPPTRRLDGLLSPGFVVVVTSCVGGATAPLDGVTVALAFPPEPPRPCLALWGETVGDFKRRMGAARQDVLKVSGVALLDSELVRPTGALALHQAAVVVPGASGGK